MSHCVQFKAHLHGRHYLVWTQTFYHELTLPICVPIKYRCRFLTGIIYCMHCAGGRDCNPSPDGRYYVGSTSVTKSGRRCQAWTSQSLYGDGRFPDGSRAAAVNYCRNPGNLLDGLWCYTTGPAVDLERRLEKCDVPDCGQSLRCITQTVVEKMPFHAFRRHKL